MLTHFIIKISVHNTYKLQLLKKAGLWLVTLYKFTSYLINLFRYVPSNVHAQVSCRYPIEKIGVDRRNISWSYRPENDFYQLESINKNSLGGSMVFSLQYFVRKPKNTKIHRITSTIFHFKIDVKCAITEI